VREVINLTDTYSLINGGHHCTMAKWTIVAGPIILASEDGRIARSFSVEGPFRFKAHKWKSAQPVGQVFAWFCPEGSTWEEELDGCK
jgi:hypothetical protein